MSRKHVNSLLKKIFVDLPWNKTFFERNMHNNETYILELKKKLEKFSTCDEKIKVIWGWIKQENSYLNLKIFTALIKNILEEEAEPIMKEREYQESLDYPS